MPDTTDPDRIPLRTPPTLIHINPLQWAVALPSIYRYEDQQWIDLFFETGRLRLSTFQTFSKYTDEVRKDAEEGTGMCYGENGKGEAIMVFQTQGLNALVLCGTHRLDKAMRAEFRRDSAFQITDTVHFAHEVAKQLPGFQQGLEGSCIYRDKRMIERQLDFDRGRFETEDGDFTTEMLADAASALGGPELMFLKKKEHEAQAEYRLLWFVATAQDGPVDIDVPDARKFCRKVADTEY